MPKKKTAVRSARKTAAKKTSAKAKTATKAKAKAKTASKAKAKAKTKTTAKAKTVAKAKAVDLPAVKAIKDKMTAKAFYDRVAELSGLTVKEVKRVFAATEHTLSCCLKKRSCGEVTIPGMIKLTIRVRPARAKGKGVNPFTGEPMIIKARPATRIVKARVLKKVKDMAEA